MLHTGSRGIGHQTCTDHLKVIDRLAPALGIRVPDRQLSCLPVERPEAAAYLGAMHAAGNFALANRHVLADGVRRAFAEVLGRPVAGLGMDLVYDVGHGQARGARGRRAPPHPVRPPQGGDRGQDATAVVETCAQVGLSRVVARLRPAGVLKGRVSDRRATGARRSGAGVGTIGPQGWADGDRVGTDAMGMPSRSRCSSGGGRSMTDAVPEADALEQRQPLLDRDIPEQVPEIDVEVPEEDALEQAMPVPFDEDDAPR